VKLWKCSGNIAATLYLEKEIANKGTIFVVLYPYTFLPPHHILNMEVDLRSLFGLRVTWCAQQYSLAETKPSHSIPPYLDSYTRALLGSKDRRRHLFVTPWSAYSIYTTATIGHSSAVSSNVSVWRTCIFTTQCATNYATLSTVLYSIQYANAC
jgi:hypothetical protein